MLNFETWGGLCKSCIFSSCESSFNTHFLCISFLFFFLSVFLKLINLFLAALGLRCCAQAFSSCSELGLLFVVVRGLLIAVASLVAEHGCSGALGAQASVVAAHRLNCSAVCGIFPDQGLKPRPLHWQADS